MATLTKRAYEAMSEKERNLLLKVVSTDNVLRGMPSFQEWCAAQQKMHQTAFGVFLAGVFVGVFLALSVLYLIFGGW